jgi:Co/Zn/Cd efflux system component
MNTQVNPVHSHVFLGASPGDATITDLHVWRVGPQAHAAIVSVLGQSTTNAETIRERLEPVHEVSHLTVELRTR